MISPLTYQDYKEYLRDVIADKDQKRGFQSLMAKAMNCQAAYLSQSLRGKVELTEDHGVKLAGFLKLNSLESEFLLLLLRFSRATTPELRSYLDQKRIELLQKSGDLVNVVQAKSIRDSEAFRSKYFSSWIPTVIHIATSSTAFQTVEKIEKRFALPKELIEETLAFLMEYSLVKKENGKYIFSGESIHLPKSSETNGVYQMSLRSRVIKSIEESRDKNNIHFSSVFTIDKKSYKEIQDICSRAIEGTHKVVHESGTEEMYALCVDLFKVV